MAYFSEATIERVWEKAQLVDGYDPAIWRKDFAGAWINRNAYGTIGQFGWVVNHLRPVIFGGSNEIGNLKPLHWINSRTKGNDYPHFKTSKSSDGNTNVDCVQKWKVL